MCILSMAQAVSVHTARWLNQLKGQGWDIRLKPGARCVKHIKTVIRVRPDENDNASCKTETTSAKGSLATSDKACKIIYEWMGSQGC